MSASPCNWEWSSFGIRRVIRVYLSSSSMPEIYTKTVSLLAEIA
ncbi:hypothetical protein J2739_004632 [Variovorax soli]|uniref:Uncharacterized protein n=1 Tax=Variovorax soli TaxID=376815 RepID=A0ABU1NK53_9BURK|nr:hypothetical protein [Variovorax soli]